MHNIKNILINILINKSISIFNLKKKILTSNLLIKLHNILLLNPIQH